MKLFTKYSRKSAVWLLILFLAGSVGYYVAVRFVLIRQVDETLLTEREETEAHVRLYGTLPQIPSTSDQQISFVPVRQAQPGMLQTVYNKHEGESTNLRQISYPISCGGTWYRYTVSIPLEHTQTLLQSIVLVTVVLMGILLLVLYAVNRWLTRRLMAPLYNTIDRIREYSPVGRQELALPVTDIDEFAELNTSIRAMSTRVDADFRRIKDFTAHAAHELQTPVAVVRSSLDNLLQAVTPHHAEAIHIERMERALDHLSRMQRSLLLLTRVEAGQFPSNSIVGLKGVVERSLADYEELVAGSHIKIRKVLEPVSVTANESLCQSMIGNLLRNAIRYNIPGGLVQVSLEEQRLTIVNKSYLPHLDFASLFQPFYRHAETLASGTGLGLSIVKKICDSNGWYLEYGYLNERHSFSIWFAGKPA